VRYISAMNAADSASTAWRVIRPAGRFAPLQIRQLWTRRDLAVMLAVRDLRLRYRQTLLGVIWVVLQPALGTVLFVVIFGRVAGLPSDGLPYAPFVLTGLVAWFFISNAASTAAESLVEHRSLVTDVAFPRVLAPLAAVMAAAADLLIGLLLLIPVLIAASVAPPIQVLTLPIWLVFAVLIASAAALWLSAANVLYRDVRYTLGFVLQLWFFASPIVFPSSLIHDGWSYLFAVNPVAGLVDGMRWCLLDGPLPAGPLAVSVVSTLVAVIGGMFYFRSVERTFADRI
jgi:lipopolysaccharide transport system permease protein